MNSGYDVKSRARILGNVLLLRRPFILFQRVTLRCNSRCRACDWWCSGEAREEGELSLETQRRIMREAGALGFAEHVVYGGEPLLRGDLPEILAESSEAGLNNIVATNALLLEERAGELASRIAYCLISIDGIGEDHDALRGVPGGYDAALRGIEALRRIDNRVVVRLWSQVNRQNHRQVEQIAKLARDLDAELEYIRTWSIEGFSEDMSLPEAERCEAFARIAELKRLGYPIVNSYSALQTMGEDRPFSCNAPRLSVTFDWNGDVLPCVKRVDEPYEWLPNIRDVSLEQLISNKRYRKALVDLKSCNECHTACAMSLKGHFVFNRLRALLE